MRSFVFGIGLIAVSGHPPRVLCGIPNFDPLLPRANTERAEPMRLLRRLLGDDDLNAFVRRFGLQNDWIGSAAGHFGICEGLANATLGVSLVKTRCAHAPPAGYDEHAEKQTPHAAHC